MPDSSTQSTVRFSYDQLVDLSRVVEQLPGPDTQGLSDVEESLVQQSSSTQLNVNQYVARDARPQGKRLLGEPTLCPERPNLLTDLASVMFPRRSTFRVVLAGARRHCPSNRAGGRVQRQDWTNGVI